MTCKDCIHYNACKGTYMNVSEYKSITDFDGEHYADIYHCPDFVDKSKWVHLPCEVGDQVFSIIVVGSEPTIVTDCVSGFIIVGDMVNVTTNWYLDGGEWKYNIFPTQEEAEKALEKRRRK